MGGKSKSSNSTKTSNVSGQNAISGDNLGTAISGINNSTLNVTSTDHGAIKGSLALGQTAIESTTEFATDALHMTSEFAHDTLEEFSATNSENLQMMAGLAGNQATQNAKNLGAVMELAKFKQDNGTNEQHKMNLYLVLFVAAILGFVTYKAVR